MDKYYYLISQLPELQFGKSSYMTSERFLEEAGKWLPLRDRKRLENIDFSVYEPESGDSDTVRLFKAFEEKFRKDLALWREARKKSRDYKPAMFPVSAVREGNPLEKEQSLLRLRWQFISTLEQGHHFDFDYIALYYMKLQIQDRLSLFEPEKGLERFQTLCKVSV